MSKYYRAMEHMRLFKETDSLDKKYSANNSLGELVKAKGWMTAKVLSSGRIKLTWLDPDVQLGTQSVVVEIPSRLFKDLCEWGNDLFGVENE